MAARESLETAARGLTIGKVSARSGCNIETIRYYERIGILKAPARTASGQRVYGDEDLDRLRFVRRARDLGFALDSVRQLLAMVDGGVTSCGEVRAIALDHLADVRRKLGDLRRMERALRATADQCEGGAVPHCPVIEMLAASLPEAQKARPPSKARAIGRRRRTGSRVFPR